MLVDQSHVEKLSIEEIESLVVIWLLIMARRGFSVQPKNDKNETVFAYEKATGESSSFVMPTVYSHCAHSVKKS